MQTAVLPIDPQAMSPDTIRRAADVLRRGGLVAFPTETVYGLGANALDAAAVARIFEAKGRPANNPVIVHVGSTDEARQLVASWPEHATRLAECFWPGPLTLVLPRRSEVPDIVTAGGPTVAIRVPKHPIALALLQAASVPVAAPSANRSMQLSPTRAEHVVRGLDGRIDLLLDGGPTSGGIESTVLDLSREIPRLLRPGLISPALIEEVVGPIQLPGDHSALVQGPLPSPGMLARHYAPRAPLELAERGSSERVQHLRQNGAKIGWLPFGEDQIEAADPLTYAMPTKPAGYAARLYAVLHEMDVAGVTRIIVDLPPDSGEWLAVRDRLQRAATPESKTT